MYVTFRTADSLPASVIKGWKLELHDLLERNEIYFSAGSLDSWLSNPRSGLNAPASVVQQMSILRRHLYQRSLDGCHGACLLREPHLSGIVADAIKFFDGKCYDLDRFVVMPNHVHVLVQMRGDFDLKNLTQSWMRYTAREINTNTGREGPFWQPETFDHLVRNEEQFHYLQKYILDNPTKSKLKKGEYHYWERPQTS